jgi:hypothetical protein
VPTSAATAAFVIQPFILLSPSHDRRRPRADKAVSATLAT